MSNGNGHHWSKFCWRDHQWDVALRACSLPARGYWMAMLCVMHEGTPVGYLTVNGRPVTTKQMASIAFCTEREAKKCEAELEEAGIFSRTEEGVIYCRRMAREALADAAAKEAWEAHGKRGGNPQIIRGTVAKAERQRPYRRSDSPLKTERIFQRDGGCCHWCHTPLVRDNPKHPQFFHVDHIVAVRDGGGVGEDNLVAACQRCNMERARHSGSGTSDSNPLAIPTATLRTFRQQPKKNLEVESEIEPEKREVSFKNTFLSSQNVRARGSREQVSEPDALDALLSEEGIEPPKAVSDEPEEVPNVIDILDAREAARVEMEQAGAIGAQVRRAAKALAMRIPFGVVRSVEAQLDALDAQPAAVGADASMGLRWAPAEPVRSVEEQRAALLATCTPEQIARAQRYAARHAP